MTVFKYVRKAQTHMHTQSKFRKQNRGIVNREVINRELPNPGVRIILRKISRVVIFFPGLTSPGVRNREEYVNRM
jgi:hypothetical protein